MFAVRAVFALFFVIAGLASAAAAQSVAKTTDWYTIAVQPPGGAPTLFLSSRSNGVTLEPYVSGDASQMWTTVADFYPGLSPVTSDSGIGINIGGLLGCVAHELSGGCPLRGSIQLPLAKLVVREGGFCLFANPDQAKATRCGITKQTWLVGASQGGNGMGTLQASAGCLTSGPTGRNANFLTVSTVGCGRGVEAWRQSFVVQLVDELSCQTAPNHICFINGKQP